VEERYDERFGEPGQVAGSIVREDLP